MMVKGKILCLFTVVLLVGTSFAEVFVSNSSDWKVAYLTGYYAYLTGKTFFAVDSAKTAEELAPYLLPKNEKIIIFEDDNPPYRNLEGLLRARGFTNVETRNVSNPYDLMFSLPDELGISGSVVIVNDSSGEWPLMAGPYAFSKKAIILFLNNSTLERIVSYVKNKGIKDITVIGYAGKRLKEEFPDALFINTGNKAEDSVEIAKLMGNPSQVFVMSGLFLYLPGNPANPADKPLWTGGGGKYPILISYIHSMDKSVEDYLLSDSVKSIIFYGAELDEMWAKIRSMAKGDKIVVEQFAVGYTNVPTRVTGQQYPMLALFMPSADINIVVEGVRLLSEGRIFLNIKNTGSSGGYFLPATIILMCGDLTKEITGKEPVFIEGKATTIYEANVGQPLPSNKCVVSVTLFYGPDTDRMEEKVERQLSAVPESPQDNSEMDLVYAKYSPRLERIILLVKNIGNSDAYVRAIIKDLYVDGVAGDYASAPVFVRKGEEAKVYIKVFLTDADLLDNPSVKVILWYGEKKDLPVHRKSFEVPLEKETFTDIVLEFISENAVLVTVTLIIVIFVFVLILRRR